MDPRTRSELIAKKKRSAATLAASTAKSSGYLSIKESFEDDVLNR